MASWVGLGRRRQRPAGNTGRFFISLKPRGERGASADQIIDRLRPQLAQRAGRDAVPASGAGHHVGGRSSRSQYQYTLQDANLDELNTWAPRLLDKLKIAARSCATSPPTSRPAPEP